MANGNSNNPNDTASNANTNLSGDEAIVAAIKEMNHGIGNKLEILINEIVNNLPVRIGEIISDRDRLLEKRVEALQRKFSTDNKGLWRAMPGYDPADISGPQRKGVPREYFEK
jgi:hypothetical protein